jgi:hypothetical protein
MYQKEHIEIVFVDKTPNFDKNESVRLMTLQHPNRGIFVDVCDNKICFSNSNAVGKVDENAVFNKMQSMPTMCHET